MYVVDLLKCILSCGGSAQSDLAADDPPLRYTRLHAHPYLVSARIPFLAVAASRKCSRILVLYLHHLAFIFQLHIALCATSISSTQQLIWRRLKTRTRSRASQSVSSRTAPLRERTFQPYRPLFHRRPVSPPRQHHRGGRTRSRLQGLIGNLKRSRATSAARGTGGCTPGRMSRLWCVLVRFVSVERSVLTRGNYCYVGRLRTL